MAAVPTLCVSHAAISLHVCAPVPGRVCQGWTWMRSLQGSLSSCFSAEHQAPGCRWTVSFSGLCRVHGTRTSPSVHLSSSRRHQEFPTLPLARALLEPGAPWQTWGYCVSARAPLLWVYTLTGLSPASSTVTRMVQSQVWLIPSFWWTRGPARRRAHQVLPISAAGFMHTRWAPAGAWLGSAPQGGPGSDCTSHPEPETPPQPGPREDLWTRRAEAAFAEP